MTEEEFEINEFQIIGLEKGIQWPPESIVPALDIFRIAILHPKINEIFCSLKVILLHKYSSQFILFLACSR